MKVFRQMWREQKFCGLSTQVAVSLTKLVLYTFSLILIPNMDSSVILIEFFCIGISDHLN